jgi:aspartate 4-decarboxylase
LIIISDTVYCTFVEKFHSFVEEIPENSVFVYSFSKYFGTTGWRLGVVMIDENNVIDRLIHQLGSREKHQLYQRYKIVSSDPESISFIDRMESDSREEALSHTGGLSCPQQAVMCLFSLFQLMDDQLKYQGDVRNILIQRARRFYDGLGEELEIRPNNTYYYRFIDMASLARKKHGDAFGKYFADHVDILEFLIELARKKFTICLPGFGFHGPQSSIRVSLANLDESACETVGRNLKTLLDEYYGRWKRGQNG